MAVRLTSFTDYTLRVLIYLALDPTRRATIQEIAGAYGISENHLMKVVHQLAQSGLVESVRGKGGGIQLARPPGEIRIGRVVQEAEGAAPIVECFSDAGNCRIAPDCRLAGMLSSAFTALYDSLDQHTLADLVETREPLVRRLQPAAALHDSALARD